MARNQEKANSMLNRYVQMKLDEKKGPKERRPIFASDCNDVVAAEKFRQEILKEIGRLVAQIQNGSLGEFKIRDMNDEINKKIREKGHWERRIVQLGGVDHSKLKIQIGEEEGQSVKGSGGYMYFGAARTLPGVKELLQPPPAQKHKKDRATLLKSVDVDYYGYRDEDDGLLVKVEAEAEKKAIAQAVEERKQHKAQRGSDKTQQDGESDSDDDDVPLSTLGGVDDDKPVSLKKPSQEYVSHVALPSQADIERLLLEKRKEDLLKKYVLNK